MFLLSFSTETGHENTTVWKTMIYIVSGDTNWHPQLETVWNTNLSFLMMGFTFTNPPYANSKKVKGIKISGYSFYLWLYANEEEVSRKEK